jgi:branched-chain amino acid transport system permease protein
MSVTIIDQIIQGILLGGLYTLFATGLSLTAGVMRFVNIAHGDFIVLACFALLSLTTALGLNPVVATIILLPIAFVVGFALQRFLLQRVVGENVLLVILVTFGLSIIIQNGLLEAYGADTQKVLGGWIETSTIALGPDLNVGLFSVLTFVAAIVLVGGLDLLLYRSGIGAKIRAVSDDVAAADLIGLSSAKIYAIAMGISFVTIGIAAGFMSVWSNFDPSSGPTRLLIAFEVIVLGGLGSM